MVRLGDICKTSCAKLKLCFGKSTPLRIAHFVTTRCNLSCSFCGCHTLKYKELDSEGVETAMDAFQKLGTMGWGFTGGEPFIRKDLPRLLSHAKRNGFFTSVVTNGTLPDAVQEVKAGTLDFIMVSYHGGAERTKKIKGETYANKVFETIKHLRDEKIKICLSSTFDDKSRDDIDDALAYSKEMGIVCAFQPVYDFLNMVEDPRLADKESLKGLLDNVEHLIKRKKEGAPVWNSMPYLEWIRSYGDQTDFLCYAGKFYATMMPDGTLRRCFKFGNNEPESDYKAAFNRLNKPPHKCYCYPWCHKEFSLNYSLNLRAVLNTLSKL